jgi:hypothetical protein
MMQEITQGRKANEQGSANEKALRAYVEFSRYGPFMRQFRKLPSGATFHGGDYTIPDMILDIPLEGGKLKTVVIEQKAQAGPGSADVKLINEIYALTHILHNGFADQCFLLIRGGGWKKGWKEFILDPVLVSSLLPTQAYGTTYLQTGELVICNQDTFVDMIQRGKL